MNKNVLKSFTDVHHFGEALLKSILVLALSMGALYGGQSLFLKGPVMSWNDSLGMILPAIVVLGIYGIFFSKDILLVSPHWLKSMVTKGWYMIAAAILFFAISLSGVDDTSTLRGIAVVQYALLCIGTGFFEEFMCRGFVQTLFVKVAERKGLSIFKGIVYASAIFGVLHIFNSIPYLYLVVGTIAQIGYATALGIILGVVYYCTKSLVGAILLHAFFNFLASFADIFTSAATVAKAMPEDLSIVGLIIQWIVVFPGVFVAYKIWKRHEEGAVDKLINR